MQREVNVETNEGQTVPARTVTIKGKKVKAFGGGYVIGAALEIGVAFLGRTIEVACIEKSGVFNFRLPELPAERANQVMTMQALERATQTIEELRVRIAALETELADARNTAKDAEADRASREHIISEQRVQLKAFERALTRESERG